MAVRLHQPARVWMRFGALVLVACSIPALASADSVKGHDERPVGMTVDLVGGARMLRLSTLQLQDPSSQRPSLAFVPRNEWGPAFGASAGLRYVNFTLGASTSIGFFRDDQDGRDQSLWNLDVDVGVKLPGGWRVEPYLTVGAGYSRADGMDDVGQDGRSGVLDGFNVHAMTGANIVVHRNFVAGLRIDGQLLLLTRQNVSFADAVSSGAVMSEVDANTELDEARGTTIGGTLGLLLDAGWRI